MTKALSTTHLSDEALLQLRSVFDSTKEHYTDIPLDERNLLFSMCTMVAKAGHMPCEFPGHLPEGKTIEEAVQSIATASQFSTRHTELTGKWWGSDNGPLLAFIGEESYPCALIPRRAGGYDMFILDEGKLYKQKINTESAAKLNGLAYSFYRALPEKKLGVRDIFHYIIQGMMPDIGRLLVTGLLIAGLGLLVPMAMGILFDQVVPNADIPMLWQFVVGLSVAAIAVMLFNLVSTFTSIRLQLKINTSLQAAVIDRLLRLPVRFFRDYSAGDLAMRASGIDEIQETMTTAVLSSLLSGAFSFLLLALMFYYDTVLALYAVALVLVVTFINIAATLLQLKYQRAFLHVQGQLSGLVLQLLTSVGKLRSTNSEASAFAQWSKQFTLGSKLFYAASKIIVNLGTFRETFLLTATMVLYALVIWRAESLTFGSFVAFNAAFGQFMAAFLGMAAVIANIVEVIPTYERIKPILQTLPEKTTTGTDPGPLTGKMELTRVSFRYSEEMPFVFRDLSIDVKPGEFVALVGPSGVGKSTIFRLLLAFERPEAGCILYDDCDLQTLNLESIRRQIGVVMQHSAIIPASILENVIGTGMKLGEKEVWQALKAVALDKDVEAMPMKLYTLMTEGGNTLSVGQRQRLMIARAIVRRPKILLFDEATSALDNYTQAIVHRNLARLKVSRLVAAHRLSTIQHADRIFVLKDGKIVEEGRFEDLVAKKGIFAELAQRQQAQLGADKD